MCSKTAPEMTCHNDNASASGELRHPSDSQTWKVFDEEHPDFSSEPRNVRLGLASDGFQPFGSGRASYSIWPVILIPYNVSPTTCMDSSNFILSMLIPGPKSPGDSIDVYLQPLIDELMTLWNIGVLTYDASLSGYFNMRAALLWTINDFPAYANLSGWSTKGKLACPCCNKNTSSTRLVHGKKECYMGHRRFLPHNHRWRRLTDEFDGHTELRPTPEILSGQELYSQARDLKGICLSKYRPVKTRISHEQRGDNWNKLSIFFELPYWKSIYLRHNLDVMHIEKNICDSLFGTIMDISEKTKDGLAARRDLELLNIKPSLHPVEVDGVLVCPPAPYTLSSEQKKRVCEFLKDVRMPEGFCSNIAGCVNVAEKKISGLKSHDCHILLQYLLPLATRSLLSDDVYETVVKLSNFFRLLCQKKLDRETLADLHEDIILILCKLETIFPHAFFDIMVHLPVHLALEAVLGGPVQYRWMYPVEQYMRTLKTFLRNKNHPEASICESYLLHESMSLCARYLEANETSTVPNSDISIFSTLEDCSIKTPYTYPQGDWERAHVYILKNCPEADPYYREFMSAFGTQQISGPEFDRLYLNYFKTRVTELRDTSQSTLSLQILASGPTHHASKCNSCKINGYKFNTEQHDAGLTTQNCGVLVIGNDGTDIINYYGVLTDIIDVQYFGSKQVIVFKCRWFDVLSPNRGIKVDKYGFESVNINRTIRTQNHDPFVLASQAHQVFYVTDMASRPGWKIVTRIPPRYTSI